MSRDYTKILMRLNSVDSAVKRAQTIRQRRNGRPPELTVREVAALESGAKVIPLTRGKWAIVDSSDFEELNRYLWCACPGNGGLFYAKRRFEGRLVPIHCFLMPLQTGWVDHKNGDALDNRRMNLRPATFSQNAMNRGVRSDNKLGIKGVCFHRASGKYCAQIEVDGRNKWLGLFRTPDEAHAAYCTASTREYGEFARHS